MKFNLWKILNWLFFLIVMFGSVYFIKETKWDVLEPLDIIRECGILGGLMYLGGYFWEEITKKDVRIK